VTTMYCCACTAISRRRPSVPWLQQAWMPTPPGRRTGGGPLRKSPTGSEEHRTSSRTHEPAPRAGPPAPTAPSTRRRGLIRSCQAPRPTTARAGRMNRPGKGVGHHCPASSEPRAFWTRLPRLTSRGRGRAEPTRATWRAAPSGRR
jgi:hypothetical protein